MSDTGDYPALPEALTPRTQPQMLVFGHIPWVPDVTLPPGVVILRVAPTEPPQDC